MTTTKSKKHGLTCADAKSFLLQAASKNDSNLYVYLTLLVRPEFFLRSLYDAWPQQVRLIANVNISSNWM